MSFYFFCMEFVALCERVSAYVCSRVSDSCVCCFGCAMISRLVEEVHRTHAPNKTFDSTLFLFVV